MGRDPLGRYPENSVFAAASPHFYGDLPRRRSYIEAHANNQKPDDRRSFAGRPALAFAKGLQGTGLFDSWGAHCSFLDDASFKDWNCAKGFKRRIVFSSKIEPGRGIYLAEKGHDQVGDPTESGQVVTDSKGAETSVKTEPIGIADPQLYMSQPQSATPGNKTGGFSGSMLHLKNCDQLASEAGCGPLPGSKAGFKACLGKGTIFLNCLREFSTHLGLRGSKATERGVCVPPYFLFQVRIDRHSASITTSAGH